MAEKQGIDWSSLWKKEDWWGVWIGFFIIALVLAGLTVKIPKFKWTTDGEFSSYSTKMIPVVEKLTTQAEEKQEVALKDSLIALKTAMDAKDRKAINDAAKKVEDSAKAAKDEGLKKRAGKLGKDVRGQAGAFLAKIFSAENIQWIIYIGIGYFILCIFAMALMGEKVGSYLLGYPIVFILAVIGLFIAGNYTVHEYGVEYVLWCLFLGLFVSNVLGTPEWLKVAVRTEFYIKSGLVILGTRILFGEILKAGAYGLIQALGVVFVVWYFCYWFAKKLKVDDDFAAILASGVSICGVSAAIASAGAIKGDPKKLSYVISVLLICSIPMIIGMPMIIKATGMSEVVGGAWIGGTIDNSGSVVAATEMVSETAMKIGVIVKLSQNVLIGFAAFILAVVWTFKKSAEAPGGERPGFIEVWYRFPKFVVGFLISSLVFSFLLEPKTVETAGGALRGLQTWWFSLAFVCIGLETRFIELAKLGEGRPAIAFFTAQAFNIIWTLVLAYLIFGGILFPAPKF